MGETIVTLSNVSFSFSKCTSPILQNISFNVIKGEFIGILGPNGAGKTTLIKLIYGFLKPIKGEIYFNGKEISKICLNERAKHIAVVPQDFHPTFNLTVGEVVLSGRRPYLKKFSFEGKKDVITAEEAMKATNVFHLRNRYINEISGGEKQRVIIAKALAQEPTLLLLDEPTTFLDIKHQIEVYNLLQKLNKVNGLTIIAVLHDINIARIYCNRIIFLKEGKIYSKGEPLNIITPQNISKIYDIPEEFISNILWKMDSH